MTTNAESSRVSPKYKRGNQVTESDDDPEVWSHLLISPNITLYLDYIRLPILLLLL